MTPPDGNGAAAGDAQVKRFSHGSRVPGWDQAVDLDKDPAAVPDPATTPVPSELRAEIEARMALYPDRRSAAIPALALAQRHHGWCSPEAIEQVACVMRVTPAYLSALATFYDMLETEAKPPHDIYVCTNISCSLRGADRLYEAMREATGDDPQFNVRSFECLGACDIAPMASVDGVYVGPLEPTDVPALLNDVRDGRPVLPSRQLVRRHVADPDANHEQFPLPDPQPATGEPQAAIHPGEPERAVAGPLPGAVEGGEPPAADHGDQRGFEPPDPRQGKR
ncbi:MAG: NAD(P)H-dependent oxidoreductase subunit E [Solirubrobacteraceae bacterium]